MNTRKKNQHFVPKFYLRNFSYLKNQKQIGLYNIRNKIYIDKAPIKSQGSKDFFYGADGTIEDNLAEIEGHLSAILKKVITSDSFELNIEDKYCLLQFIVMTDLRNPTRINGFLQMFIGMREKIMVQFPNTKNLDEIMPIPSHENFIELSLSNIQEIVEKIIDLGYKMLINLTQTPFITSDNPVVTYNQYLEWKRWPHTKAGYGSVGAQIFLPLNDKMMIVFYDANIYKIGDKNSPEFKIKKDEDVDELNLLQFVNCMDTIYFNEKIDRDYLNEMHNWATEFIKANVTYSQFANLLVKNDTKTIKKSETKNLVISSTTPCETELKINGFKIKYAAKLRKLTDSIVQLRTNGHRKIGKEL